MRRAWLLAAACVPVVAAWSLWAQWRAARPVPPPAAWQRVVARVASQWQPTDGLYLWPTWVAYDGEAVAALLARSRRSHDEAFLHADPLELADLVRFRHLWILAPESDPLPALLGPAQPVAEAQGLRAYRLDVPVGPARYDFLAQLADARVERVDRRGHVRPCAWHGDRHRCDARSWTSVRALVEEVGHTRRRVVFTHAHPPGGLLRVAYADVELGETLQGGVGLTLQAVRKDEGGEAWFRIRVGDEVVWRVQMPKNDFVWHTFAIDTRHWAGQPVDVVFELGADDTRRRQLGFDAVTW